MSALRAIRDWARRVPLVSARARWLWVAACLVVEVVWTPGSPGRGLVVLTLVTLGMRMRVSAIIAVALAIAVHAPVCLSFPLGPLCLCGIYVVLLDERGWSGAFRLGVYFTIAHVLVSLHWTLATLARAWPVELLLIALAGTYYGIAFTLVWCVLRARWRTLVPCAALVIPAFDLLRAANPVLPLGYVVVAHAANEWDALNQLAEPLGWLGFACFVSLSSLLAAYGYRLLRSGATRRAGVRAALVWVGMLLIAVGSGSMRRDSLTIDKAEVNTLAFVQRYNPRGIDIAGEPKPLQDFLPELLGCGAEIAIIPETGLVVPHPKALPIGLVNRPSIGDIQALLVAYPHVRQVLAGVHISLDARDNAYRNVVMAIERDGVTGVVDKCHGSPIGEVAPLPWLPLIGPLLARFGEGTQRLKLQASGATLGALFRWAACVCQDQTDPRLFVGRIETWDDVSGIVIVADNRWFKYAQTERLQSRAARKLTAVIHRRAVAYCANGGSEVVTSSGALAFAAPAQAGVYLTEITLRTKGVRPWVFTVLTLTLAAGVAVFVSHLARTTGILKTGRKSAGM